MANEQLHEPLPKVAPRASITRSQGVVSQAHPSPSPAPAPAEAAFKIWINQQWYTKVNAQGYVLGACAEGALGYIVQLYPGPRGASEARAALKVPRLRADTLEDNAYIAEVLREESKNVIEANARSAVPPGLVPTAHNDADALRGVRQLHNLIDEEAAQQRGSVPFISYSYGHRLRICNVKLTDSGISVYPDTAELRAEFASLTPEIWNEISGKNESAGLDFIQFQEAAYFRVKSLKPEGKVPADGEKSGLVEKRPTLGLISSQRTFGKLQPSLSPTRPSRIWFAGVPSIILKWANNTLQMAISDGIHRAWQCTDYYSLLHALLGGLVTLHRRGIVHGDVRPANVMALGEPTEADRYALSDYGSFSSDQTHSSGTPPQATGMSTAPGIARHRASTFYARERRAGTEREDADVAVIISQRSLRGADQPLLAQLPDEVKQLADSLPSNEYFIRLGWKKHVVKAETNEIDPAIIAEMIKRWNDLTKVDPRTKSRWALAQGDQIRLRDYVFKILSIHEQSGVIYLRCDRSFCRVLMERISVYSSHDLFETARDSLASIPPVGGRDEPGTTVRMREALLLDLPSWVEIRQTSVASDLYSIGVMALYLVYAASLSDSTVRERMKQSSGTSMNVSRIEPKEIEQYLGAIVRRLEDENNFNHLWDNLNVVCRRIETCFKTHVSAQSLLKQEYVRKEVNAPVVVGQSRESSDEAMTALVDRSVKAQPTPFQSEVEDLVSTIVSTSPELRWILYYFSNAAYFLFFIEFVLSCMHRKSHVQSEPGDASGRTPTAEPGLGAQRLDLPFCEHRFERPSDSPAAKKAQDRIRQLTEYMNPDHKFFKDFGETLNVETVHQVSGGDIQLRREHTRALKDKKSLRESLSERERDCERLGEALNQERSQGLLFKKRIAAQEDQVVQLDNCVRELAALVENMNRSWPPSFSSWVMGQGPNESKLPEELRKEFERLHQILQYARTTRRL